MQIFRNHSRFAEVSTNEAYEQAVIGLLSFRSDGFCYVYWTGKRDDEEILVGYGQEPFEIEMHPGQFRVASDNRVWIAQRGIQQFTEAASDEVFTTLDRPAPLSPEMAAIARLVRQNELERQVMRSRFEAVELNNAELRMQQSRREDKLDVVEDAEDQQTTSPKTRGSKAKSGKRPDTKAKPETTPDPDPDNDEDES